MNKKLIQFFSYLLFFSAITLFSVGFGRKKRQQQDFIEVCQLVLDKIYLSKIQLVPWYQSCIHKSQNLDSNLDTSSLLSQINQHLNTLSVSHLGVYSEVEDRQLWTGVYKETGLKIKNWRNRFFVFEVLSGSSAELAGVKRGDEILQVNGQSLQNINIGQLEKQGGDLVVFRFKEQKKIEYNIEPKTVHTDFSPQLKSINNNWDYLKISSFRSEYFSQQDWRSLLQQISLRASNSRHLVIDIRDNYGGSFVAMLRALSPFLCQSQVVGHLYRDVSERTKVVDASSLQFTDQFNEVELLENHPKENFILKSFGDYGCYKGKLAIIMNSSTSSVAEIFASVLKGQRSALLVGETSAGNVLLSGWYPMKIDLMKVRVSVPEAIYTDLQGHMIEGIGVSPDIYPEHTLEDLIRGQDSWVQAVLRSF